MGNPWPADGAIASWGEDLPDAYRYTHMVVHEADACLVVWWHPDWKTAVVQKYWGMLFGLPNAVTSFNRWQKFARAVVRRTLACLFTMYFDDGTAQDWASSATDAQRQVAELMKLLGSP